MDDRMTGLPKAIEVLTAWTESDKNPDLVWERVMQAVEAGAEEEVEMTLGLMKLASILLVRLSGATGKSQGKLLQEIALKYAT